MGYLRIVRQMFRRQFGQILLDGKFLRKNDLDRALEVQQHFKDLLGQVLVRIGVLHEADIKAPLMLQEHLGTIDDAVKVAAGERQLLGALLVQSGHITDDQLDLAVREQKRSGERIGEVFMRLGMLTHMQLKGLLDFQWNQGRAGDSPVRLGELLVAGGHITREQLGDALAKQKVTRKKIGEVLVEAGYARASQIRYGMQLQRMLMSSALGAIMAFGLTGTGQASSVKLQWDPSTDSALAGYRVYYSADNAPLEGVSPIEAGTQTSMTVSGLDPLHAYNFAVTAYNSSGVESTFSNVVTLAEQTPPTVSIVSPASGASVSGSVSINVDANDNVGVTKVEFYVNGVLKSADQASPYVYSWDTTALAPGTYSLMVKAYDAAGNVGQSTSSVTVANDLIPPVVFLASPATNTTVSGLVSVAASATDNVGVSRVEFYSNGSLMYVSNVSPYSFNWDTTAVANGSYALMAVAYDNAGNVGQSSAATVTVKNPVADLTAPVVASFALPAASSTLAVPVTAFSASDNVGVTGYLITESATPPAASAAGWSSAVPASFTFSGPGSRTAYAWARDAAGNVSAARSAVVAITLPDLIAPVVSIPSPASGAVLSGSITVTSQATDNVGVARVEFYVDGVLKSIDTASPYYFIWDTTAVANGSHTLTAKAYDAAGNVGQSSSISVTVSNPTSYGIWGTAAVPAVIDSGDTKAVEIGVKFRSNSAGTITGIRFYKAASNTGTHVASLWSSSGQLLAQATFKSESTSGWQVVTFTNPVTIAANTVYTASYHTNSGHYSFDQNYFAAKGADNGPLHALSATESGGNGVYAYGSKSAFPTKTYNNTNYWVDVVFKK